MYNSIQHLIEFGTGKIEEKIKSFIQEQKDLGDLVIGLQEEIFEFGRNIVKEVLEDMDEYLRKSGVRKKGWEIVRKDPSGILTTFGQVIFERTYFKPYDGGQRKYLVDEVAGIKPHDRLSSDVIINALEEASESSYRKGGEKAAYMDEVTKQTIMNKVHELEIVQPKVKVESKKELRILHIEADEDHVARQGKKSSENNNKKKNILMPKLVYVHEGIDLEKSTEKRKVLKNPRYFGGLRKSEELWLEVSQYIDDVYDLEKVETIYISGDGAGWIQQGLDWIPKSRFVLDNHHLNKYFRDATAHLDNEAVAQGLEDALDDGDRDMMEKVFRRIMELTENEKRKKAVRAARTYMLNNWHGIEIKVDNFEIVGCSAEGHVSHIFSNRLSSRPKGWSRIGVDKMSQLIIFRKNGGKVYDLVMAQKRKEQKEQKNELQDELIREIRTSGKRYENVWNSNVTVFNKGHKTRLYNGLRSIIGM